jgi:hypothetical protein
VWRLPTAENGSSNPCIIAGPIRVDELMDRIVCEQPLIMRFEIDLACCTRCDPLRSRVDVAPQAWILPGRFVCDGGRSDSPVTENGALGSNRSLRLAPLSSECNLPNTRGARRMLVIRVQKNVERTSAL